MKVVLLTSLLFVCMLGHVYSQQVDVASCLAKNWIACAGSLTTAVVTLHLWSPKTAVNLLGHQCHGQYKGNWKFN